MVSLRRLRTLQLNDNPFSNEEEHIDKVLNAIPWLIELNSEPIQDIFRKKSIQSIFLKNMEVAGIQYLYEKIAQANVPFISLKNPKNVQKKWLKNFSNQYSFTNEINNSKLEALNREIIDIIQGKTKTRILWATILELHQMAKMNPILRGQLGITKETNLYSLVYFPCYFSIEENWNCLAFQEMFESHRKNHIWSKKISLKKEFYIEEGKFEPQAIEKEVYLGKGLLEDSHNIDQYFLEHLEYVDTNYKDVYKENVEYKIQIDDQLLKIMQLQALAKSMLARKRHIRVHKLIVDVLVVQEEQQLIEKWTFESSILRIQVCIDILNLTLWHSK